jgi:transposase
VRVSQEGGRGAGEPVDHFAGSQAHGLQPKKRTLGATERDEFLRAAWRKIIRAKNPTDLVFVDECSSNTSLAPLYGWARCGERVHQKAPRNWGKNITLISSIGKEWGMGASLVVEGSTNRTVFETYLEDVLCPTLQEGQVVVMDNLSAHKGERVRELIEGRECELVYLPPYSPDFNPIEQAFSKLKSYLRAACARSQQMLMEVIGEALRTISASDAEGFFEHCGYRAVVQSL